MSSSEAQEGRELFSDEDDQAIEAIAKPLDASDRAVDNIDVGFDPEGDKEHPWFMDTRVQAAVIFAFLILASTGVHAIVTGGRKKPVLVAGPDAQVTALKQKLADYEGQDTAYTSENAGLTQDAQFSAVPLDPGQPTNQNGTTPARTTANTPPPPPPQPQRRPVTAQNTVRVPTNRRIPSAVAARPPVSAYKVRPRQVINKKPSGPSLAECVEYSQLNVDIPACKIHRIKVKQVTENKPVTIGRNTRPVTAKKKVNLTAYKQPIKTAYARPTATQKPQYTVNFMAGEIQTVDQYEAEMKSGSSAASSAPTAANMKAKVVRHIVWRSPEEASKLKIPLTIESGTHKGKQATAKITSLNGLQFTAELVEIGGQKVEPGQYIVERDNTPYLIADHKHQGGPSFGKRLLGTTLAVAGEVASDQLANVRGGNHISGLVPNGGQQQGTTGQFFKFSGKVNIVRSNQG